MCDGVCRKMSLSVTALTISNVAKIESTTESDTVLHHEVDNNQQQRILLREKNRGSISVFDGVISEIMSLQSVPVRVF